MSCDHSNGRGPSARPSISESDLAAFYFHFGRVDPVDDDQDPEEVYAPVPYDEWEPWTDAPIPAEWLDDDEPPAPGTNLKESILDLFRKLKRPMGEFQVWTYFANVEPRPRPALINAALFTLADEGKLNRQREPYLDRRGTVVYSLPSTTGGVAK